LFDLARLAEAFGEAQVENFSTSRLATLGASLEE
jgi:hypothetical protein